MLNQAVCCGAPHNSTLDAMYGYAAALAVLVTAALLSGCPAAPLVARALSTEEDRRDRFEKGWNSDIGAVRDVPRYHKEVLLETRNVTPGATEYVIRQKYECRIGLLVDNHTSIIRSWRYVSDPRKCWVYYQVE